MKLKRPRQRWLYALLAALRPMRAINAAVLLGATVVFGCVTPYPTPVPPGTGDQTGAGDIGQASEVSGPSYFIGPEDVLFISVWQEPDLQREVKVRPDGGISFPLAGNVDVAGKTVEEVTAIITERVQKYIPAAVVTVSVEQVAGYSVYVIGQVNTPGKFTLGRYVDVMQALTLAGGLTPFANSDAITIRRRQPDGTEIVLPFDYGAVQAGRSPEQNVLLRSGDTVIVP
jgi:polysaccharide export outer membrane protein